MARRLARRLLVVAVACAILASVVPTVASARSATTVVMTRNLYLGADLAPAIAAPNLASLLQAAADIYSNVVATDFGERAELIAEEIDDTIPDLIGLQEVSLWQTGTFGDPAPATNVTFDYLQLLLDALEARGLDYSPAIVQSTFDGEVPAAISSLGVPVLMDVRLIQRNAILVHEGTAFSNPRAEHFDRNVVYSNLGGIPGNDLTDRRGWVSIDVRIEPSTRSVRFVNTHLESFVAPIRDIQAQELLDGPLSTSHHVIAVGDFNSPPTGPESGAYQLLTAPSGGRMVDVWHEPNPGDPGLTCCQDPDLLNSGSSASTRIDLVLVTPPAIKTVDAFLTGTIERTPSRLWASDHFGVVAELSLP